MINIYSVAHRPGVQSTPSGLQNWGQQVVHGVPAISPVQCQYVVQLICTFVHVHITDGLINIYTQLYVNLHHHNLRSDHIPAKNSDFKLALSLGIINLWTWYHKFQGEIITSKYLASK